MRDSEPNPKSIQPIADKRHDEKENGTSFATGLKSPKIMPAPRYCKGKRKGNKIT